MRRDQDNALEALMEQLIESGTEEMASFFAALRVRPAHRDARRSTPRPEQWLLVEWPQDEPRPIKFWFSSLPVDTPVERLVA